MSVIKCYGNVATLLWRWNNLVVWPTVAKCSASIKPYMPIEHHKDGFTVMSTWRHSRNILLRMCQECSAITARPRFKIWTLNIGKTQFATTFPCLHFSIFCQITEFSYGPEFTVHPVYFTTTGPGTRIWKLNLSYLEQRSSKNKINMMLKYLHGIILQLNQFWWNNLWSSNIQIKYPD
jgi:hypothetical protein